MVLYRLVAGAAVLTLGRKLFWLFVGALGFVWAEGLAVRYMIGSPAWLVLVVALIAGVIGAVVAIFARWVGIILAGFWAGSVLATSMMAMLSVDLGALNWLVWIVAGVAGAFLFARFLDWGLIILSSLTGAGIIVRALTLTNPLAWIVWLILIGVGIYVQANILEGEQD